MFDIPKFAALAISTLALCGCATMTGGPDRLGTSNIECKDGPISQSVRNVLVDLQCTNVDWLSGDASALQTQRNNVVTIRMFLIDQRYNDWERNLVNESRSGNLTATLASLGLSGAGSLIEQGNTSQTLAALNTALTGSKQSFDKEILFDRTLPILMTQMRASRAKIKELLIKRLNTSYNSWPIGLAMSELEAYEHAGTINAALMAVAENSATERKANEDRAEQAVVTISYDSSSAGTALQDYLAVDDANLYNSRADKLATAMKAVGIANVTRRSLTDFAVGADIRKRDVIYKLIELERTDTTALTILAAGLAAD